MQSLRKSIFRGARKYKLSATADQLTNTALLNKILSKLNYSLDNAHTTDEVIAITKPLISALTARHLILGPEVHETNCGFVIELTSAENHTGEYWNPDLN